MGNSSFTFDCARGSGQVVVNRGAGERAIGRPSLASAIGKESCPERMTRLCGQLNSVSCILARLWTLELPEVGESKQSRPVSLPQAREHKGRIEQVPGRHSVVQVNSGAVIVLSVLIEAPTLLSHYCKQVFIDNNYQLVAVACTQRQGSEQT